MKVAPFMPIHNLLYRSKRALLFVNTHGCNLFLNLNDGGMSMALAAWRIVLFAPESIMSFGFESV